MLEPGWPLGSVLGMVLSRAQDMLSALKTPGLGSLFRLPHGNDIAETYQGVPHSALGILTCRCPTPPCPEPKHTS